MPKVSVIVPVYNAEKTLIACLNSLISQTLTDIEYILVNDCSTDHSFKILQDFEAQFSGQVILIDSDVNQGAGGARNIALQYASGEYIGFVDSDDIVTSDMYEKLYNKAIEQHYDIVDCAYYNEETDTALLHTSDELCGVLTPKKRNELIAGGGYICTKIFRKEFLDSIDFTFRNNCILEDMETLILAFATARSIATVKETMYCYKYYSSSASRPSDTGKTLKNLTAAIEAIYRLHTSLESYHSIRESAEYSIVNLCTLCIAAIDQAQPAIPAYIAEQYYKQLQHYINTMLTIPIEHNTYVQQKITKETINTLQQRVLP